MGWTHGSLFIVWPGCMNCYLLFRLDAWTDIYCVGWFYGLIFIVLAGFIVWAGCMDCYLLCGLDAWTDMYCVDWMHGLLFIVWGGCMDCYL